MPVLHRLQWIDAEAKECAARYVEHLAATEKPLAPVAAALRRTAGIYQHMMQVLGQTSIDPCTLWTPMTPEQAGALVPLLREAKQSEAETVALVQRYLTA